MKNVRQMFESFENLNGAKYIGVNGYTNKQSEIANHVVNVNVSITNTKKKDFKALQSPSFATKKAVLASASEKGIAKDIVKQAWNEMIVSAEKNLAKDLADRTAASQAQTNAYLPLTKSGSVKLHLDTGNIHIFGMFESKVIVQAGEPKKPTNSGAKTIAKKIIGKKLDLRASYFRTYILSSVKAVKMSGEKIDITA